MIFQCSALGGCVFTRLTSRDGWGRGKLPVPQRFTEDQLTAKQVNSERDLFTVRTGESQVITRRPSGARSLRALIFAGWGGRRNIAIPLRGNKLPRGRADRHVGESVDGETDSQMTVWKLNQPERQVL